MEDPRFLKFGKPSISMGHLDNGELLNNQMVITNTQELQLYTILYTILYTNTPWLWKDGTTILSK